MILSRSLCVLFASMLLPSARADELTGNWSLQLESGTPAWLSISRAEDGKPDVTMRLHVGPDGPHKNIQEANGRLTFTLRQNKKATHVKTVDVGVTDGKLNGVIQSTSKDGSVTRDLFTGKKIPPMPSTPPDLSKVRFGHPISLFNGKDMTGWRPNEPDKISGWSVKDGVLVNTTPKTDFSATGAYANLRTDAVFEDFWLHIEFLVEATLVILGNDRVFRLVTFVEIGQPESTRRVAKIPEILRPSDYGAR